MAEYLSRYVQLLRIAAEGSDWKRDEQEPLEAWAARTIKILRNDVSQLKQSYANVSKEAAELRLEMDDLFTTLSNAEVAGMKIPASIDRWWQRATERREEMRAMEKS